MWLKAKSSEWMSGTVFFFCFFFRWAIYLFGEDHMPVPFNYHKMFCVSAVYFIQPTLARINYFSSYASTMPLNVVAVVVVVRFMSNILFVWRCEFFFLFAGQFNWQINNKYDCNNNIQIWHLSNDCRYFERMVRVSWRNKQFSLKHCSETDNFRYHT